MKIEIGESLMRSWLRHIEGCQIAELNWKPSFSWNVRNDTPPLMEAARERFRAELDDDIFKKQTARQLLKQAEIDVLGIRLGPQGEIAKIYCVDVAFHRNGLGYVDVAETVRRVLKKLIRHVMVVHSVFGSLPLQVVFASPKAGAPYVSALEDAMRSLATFFSAHEAPCAALLLVNHSFRDIVLNPVLAASSDVADTSELFLRSYQLLKIFDTTPAAASAPHSPKPRAPVSGETLRVEFDPSPEDIFKTALLRTRKAMRTIHYQDGRTEDWPWNASKLTETSILMDNVLTSRLRHWRRDGIAFVQIKIIES